jgi:hypothetical protein
MCTNEGFLFDEILNKKAGAKNLDDTKRNKKSRPRDGVGVLLSNLNQ